MNRSNTVRDQAFSRLVSSVLSLFERSIDTVQRLFGYFKPVVGVSGTILLIASSGVLTSKVFAQPYDSNLPEGDQLPQGVSALISVPASSRDATKTSRSEEIEESDVSSSAKSGKSNNLSGTTQKFVKQSVDSDLYAAIIEQTQWNSEWRNDQGETCLQSAAKSFNLDPVLLLAIIEQESNFNPAARNQNDNDSLDIGLMQINSQWNEFLAGVGIEQSHLFDPCVNTHVGAWILNISINEVGDVWKGVGVYNAGTGLTPGAETRRQAYAEAVSKRFNALNQKLGRERWDLAALDF